MVRSAGSTDYNYVNPVRRDVVNTGTETSDNVTIRFETNNPGPWIMHWFALLSLNYEICADRGVFIATLIGIWLRECLSHEYILLRADLSIC